MNSNHGRFTAFRYGGEYFKSGFETKAEAWEWINKHGVCSPGCQQCTDTWNVFTTNDSLDLIAEAEEFSGYRRENNNGNHEP